MMYTRAKTHRCSAPYGSHANNNIQVAFELVHVAIYPSGLYVLQVQALFPFTLSATQVVFYLVKENRNYIHTRFGPKEVCYRKYCIFYLFPWAVSINTNIFI